MGVCTVWVCVGVHGCKLVDVCVYAWEYAWVGAWIGMWVNACVRVGVKRFVLSYCIYIAYYSYLKHLRQ